MGRALKDVLQGDNVGVLDSEEDRPKPSHTGQTSETALAPSGAVAAQFRQRAGSFPCLQKIGVKTAFLP